MLKDENDVALGPNVVPTFASTHRLQWEEAQDCFVILYPEGMVKLNPSSAEILQQCDGEKNVEKIVNDLQEKYPDANLEEDILNFLEVAHNNGWIRTK